MKLGAVLAKVFQIFGYLRRRRKVKLYRQWVEMAGLTAEAIPGNEVADGVVPKIDKKQLRSKILYILLGFSLGLLCAGLILLVVQSC